MRSSRRIDKPRVVYVEFLGSGGMYHYAVNMHAAARRHVDAVMVVPGQAQPDHGSPAAPVSTLARRLRKYNPWYFRRLADRLVEEYQPDIVHITSESSGLLFFVRRLARRGVRVVYTVHDPIPHDEDRTLWGHFFSRYQAAVLTPKMLRSCAACHVHSTKHAQQIGVRAGKRPLPLTYVVPHGAGATSAIAGGEASPAELGALPKGRFTYLFFGRIEPYKGLDVLLAAYRQVAYTDPHSVLVIAGSGELPAIDEAIGDRVIVANRFIADCEIAAFFKAANVVVLPYRNATQSGVVPLASWFGKPVIASDVGALGEIISNGESGWLVPPGDAHALAAAMRQALADPDATQQVGSNAQRYMNAEFSWDAVLRQHLQWYRRLMVARDGLHSASAQRVSR